MHKVIGIDLQKLVFLAIKQLWTNLLNNSEHDASNDGDAEGNTILLQGPDLNINFLSALGCSAFKCAAIGIIN